MQHFEKTNPVAERAALRRLAWEAKQPVSFWRQKRFDVADLIVLVTIITGSGLLILLATLR